jgi:hypothetical protein
MSGLRSGYLVHQTLGRNHIHSGARRFLMSAFCFSALTQPVALAIHFENVDMVGQSVEGGAGEAF